MHRTLEQLRITLRRLTSHQYFIPVCLVVGFIVRLIWIALIHADQVSDYEWYYERALSIASGRGYAVDGILTAYWPVGYPGFLEMPLLDRPFSLQSLSASLCIWRPLC